MCRCPRRDLPWKTRNQAQDDNWSACTKRSWNWRSPSLRYCWKVLYKFKISSWLLSKSHDKNFISPPKAASPEIEFEDPSILNMGSTLPPGLGPPPSLQIDQEVSNIIGKLGQANIGSIPPVRPKEKDAYTWQQTQSMLNGNRYRNGRDSPRVSFT